MSPERQVQLLRFVTSCSRTPLLGFGHLVPPFTLVKVSVRSDKEKLPFVIEQGAGFVLD